MKLYRLYIFAAIVCTGLFGTGCSDWLDYTPEDKQTYDKQFSTEEGFHNAVNGCYNLLISGSLYGYNLTYGPIEAMRNCYFIPDNNEPMKEYSSATYDGSYATATFSGIWSSAYNTILNINTVLSAMDEFPDVLRARDAAMIKGEMLGLRAFIHLDLVRLFGVSPYKAEAMESLTVPYADTKEIIRRDRLTLSDIINNKIIPDLTLAQELLRDSDPIITDGVLNSTEDDVSNWDRYRQMRMNYYAVTLVKARAYLWIKDYTNALKEANSLIEDPSFSTTFPWVEPGTLLGNTTDPDRVFSTECLFGYYKSTMSDIYENYFAGSLNDKVQLHPAREYVSSRLFTSPFDYRLLSQWAGSLSAVTDYDFVKYRSFTPNEDNPEFWATFFGLIRKSEAYLIAAECRLNTMDFTGAANAMNTLREARGLDPIESDNSMMLAMQLLPEIKLEYCRDMRGEGQIFFLHKRNWQSFSNNKQFDGSGTNINYDRPTSEQRYTVPIPASENY